MDYTPLIKRLRSAARHDSMFGDDVREHASEQAADAIKALQAERTKYRNEYSTSHAALQLVKTERDALQARVADLQSQVNSLSVGFNNCQMDRNSALAKLAALEGQKKSTLVQIIEEKIAGMTPSECAQFMRDRASLAAGAQAQPLTKVQIDELYLECGREVSKLDAEERYTFAAWFPIAIKLAEKAHGIGGSV